MPGDKGYERNHDLDRFVQAQHGTYESALEEIRRGAKRTHWMWFVFPQMAGLGRSAIAKHYSIASLDEARAFLAHPVLGKRYRECVAALQKLKGRDAETVFGDVDAAKLRSSLTLFAEAGGGAPVKRALERWFGAPDALTLRLLRE